MPIRKRSIKDLEKIGFTEKEIHIQQGMEKEAENLESSLDELEELPRTKENMRKKIELRKEHERVAYNAAYWGVHPNEVPLDDLRKMLSIPDFEDNIEITYRKSLAEHPTLRRAVRTFCVMCQGGSQKFVAECSKTNCPLWPWRMGKNPFHSRRGITPKHLRKNNDVEDFEDDYDAEDSEDLILDVEDAVTPADRLQSD